MTCGPDGVGYNSLVSASFVARSISDMNPDYVQQTRSKLQKRFTRLSTAGFVSFHWVLLQTWKFLLENEITRGILEDLERRYPKPDGLADDVLGGRPKVGNTESEHAAVCHALLRKCVSSDCYDYLSTLGAGLAQVQNTHLPTEREQGRCVDAFCKTYVLPLFDYLEEQIDDKRMTLLLLRKFKHRCEWFRRAELLAKWNENTRMGEECLAFDLYEYLHDQGIQFHIEAHSASGEADLISSQTGQDRLVADVKIFNPEGGQDVAYLAKGFHQVYHYTKDYNEPFGFLVIFKTCEGDLSIAMPGQESAFPFITHNHKTIFLIVIDICQYEKTASNAASSRLGRLDGRKAHSVASIGGSQRCWRQPCRFNEHGQP